MARSKLHIASSDPTLVDPFSKKGALALFWLLARRGVKPGGNAEFSINELARKVAVMPFTVHRVIQTLEYDGIIQAKGLNTKKRFYLADPKALLIRWLGQYQFQKKNKLWKYGLSDPKKFNTRREEFFEASVVPALHTAAQAVFHVGATNLRTTEGYLLDPKAIPSIVDNFGLIEQERGYDVLLIEPYYRGVVARFSRDWNDPIWKQAFAVLNFLDLYTFPIRGREQAEALFRKTPALKSLGLWSHFEAIGGS